MFVFEVHCPFKNKRRDEESETHNLTDCLCLQCILSMFEDMGFINTYKIDLHTLARSDNTILYASQTLSAAAPAVTTVQSYDSVLIFHFSAVAFFFVYIFIVDF